MLPLETVYEVARCFQALFMGLEEAPSCWKIVKLVFLRKPDAEPPKWDKKLSCNAIDVCHGEMVCLQYHFSTGKRKPGRVEKAARSKSGRDIVGGRRTDVRPTGMAVPEGGHLGMAVPEALRCMWPAWTSRQPSTWRGQSTLRCQDPRVDYCSSFTRNVFSEGQGAI